MANVTAIKCKENVFCGVNMVKDIENMTDLEKKHLPIITAPQSVKKGECFEVQVEVGKIMAHPNAPGHHIEFIELYADHTYLARMDITAVMVCSVMKVCLSLDHIHSELRAFAHCNLHGTWENRVKLELTD